jgi:hypothetical protein
VRGDHLEITTKAALAQEVLTSNEMGDQEAEVTGETIQVPLVNLVVERQPLEEVLKELAEQVDYGLSLDPRIGEKARLSVSARLLNAPLDSALLVIAEMADLRPVRLDNHFFITTAERASKLPGDWWKYKPKKKRALDNLPPPGGGGGGA